MRGRKALINTLFAIVLEVVTMLSSIIVPRKIISVFGSDVNGLLTSITQFLGYLTLLESGVGGVVKAAMYKPLAEHDMHRISQVVKATEVFFRRIARASIVYVICLIILFPLMTGFTWSFFYIASLVVILGVDNISKYYFGMPYQLLIRADQKGYIYSAIQIVSTILNILIVVITIKLGFSIQVVKLVSAVVFFVRPVLLKAYVSKRYAISENVEQDNTVLAQRWNGVGFSIASFIHKKTDVFLITIFLSMKEISVYSVYSTIATGLDAVVSMTTNSFQAAFGNMMAKNEKHSLIRNFRIYNLIVHIMSFVLFPVAIVMMMSYVTLYSEGVTDVNYLRPVFGMLLILGELIFCLRMPYQAIVTAAGHYKQTQFGAVLEATINIVVSVVLIFCWGMEGVAVGTLASMLLRTLDYVRYLKKNILFISPTYFFSRIFVGGISGVIGIILCYSFRVNVAGNWFEWVIKSAIAVVIMFATNLLFNYIFYRDDIKNAVKAFCRVIHKRK